MRLRLLVWRSTLAIAMAAAGCAPVTVGAGPQIGAPRLIVADEQHEAFTTRDGLKLGVSSWTAADPRAVIVAFHGMNDYAGFIRGPAAYWQARGISTYALDQRGFGRSPNTGLWAGNAAMLGDFRDFTAEVRAHNPGVPVYLLGESMGGAVVLAGLSQPDAPAIDGVILVAPAVWGWSTMNFWYRSALWIAAHVVPGKQVTGSGLTIQPSDNIDVLRDLGSDPLVIKPTRTDAVYGLVGLMDKAILDARKVKAPILLLYGQRDEIVPRWPIQKLVEKLQPAPRIALYPNGYHLLMRDLQREVVWNDVLAFVDRANGPLPSGYEFDRQAFIEGKVWAVPAQQTAAVQ
jgi:alpha-beta hydrolase superfamily lysophospholipase